MSAAVILPIWALLLLVGATPLAGWLGARQGAKQAIALCSSHWGCAMTAEKKRVNDTQNLEEQLRALRQRHPELSNLSEAMTKTLKETGEHPAVPEKL